MALSTVNKGLKSKASRSEMLNTVKRPDLVGKVTQQQLAELAGVSMSTIRNCLHAKDIVNKKTLEHVQKIMEKYDYHPNSIAKAMLQGKSSVIGIIVPRLDVSYFAKIAGEVERLFNMSGYSSLICQHMDDTLKEDREIRLMREKRVDGIIARSCGRRTDATVYQRLAEMNLPFVLIDRRFPALDDHYLGTDDYHATIQLIDYLVKKGHERIAYIGWDPGSARHTGYLNGLKKHGITVNEHLCKECLTEYTSGRREAYELMRVSKAERPTAIVGFNSQIGINAIEALWEMGLEVPDDIAVATIGGHEDLLLSKLRLTSVVLPINTMIREATVMLYDQLENKNWKRGPILCPCELRIGNTA